MFCLFNYMVTIMQSSQASQSRGEVPSDAPATNRSRSYYFIARNWLTSNWLTNRFAQTASDAMRYVMPAQANDIEQLKQENIYYHLSQYIHWIETSLLALLERTLEEEVYTYLISHRSNQLDQHGFVINGQNVVSDPAILQYQKILNFLREMSVMLDKAAEIHPQMISMPRRYYQQAILYMTRLGADIGQFVAYYTLFYESLEALGGTEYWNLFTIWVQDLWKGLFPQEASRPAPQIAQMPGIILAPIPLQQEAFQHADQNQDRGFSFFETLFSPIVSFFQQTRLGGTLLPPLEEIKKQWNENHIVNGLKESSLKHYLLKILENTSIHFSFPHDDSCLNPSHSNDHVGGIIQVIQETAIRMLGPGVNGDEINKIKTIFQNIQLIKRNIGHFLASKKNLFDVMQAVNDIYPLIKQIITEYPAASVVVKQALKTQLLLSAYQINQILKVLTVHADRLEIQYLMKEKTISQFSRLDVLNNEFNDFIEKLGYTFEEENGSEIVPYTKAIQASRKQLLDKINGNVRPQLAQQTLRISLIDSRLEASRALNEQRAGLRAKLDRDAIDENKIYEGYHIKVLPLDLRPQDGDAQNINRDQLQWSTLYLYSHNNQVKAVVKVRNYLVPVSLESLADDKKALIHNAITNNTEPTQESLQAIYALDKKQTANTIPYLSKSRCLTKNKYINETIDARITVLRNEMNRSWMFLTQTKQKKIQLLTLLKSIINQNGDNVPHLFDEELLKKELKEKIKSPTRLQRDEIQLAESDIDLLFEGRTAQLMQNIQCIMATKEDRVALIHNAIRYYQSKIDAGFWFFKERRKHQLENQITSLKVLRRYLKDTGYRLEDALLTMSTRHVCEWTLLQSREQKLLNHIRAIEKHIPDSIIGLKIIRPYVKPPSVAQKINKVTERITQLTNVMNTIRVSDDDWFSWPKIRRRMLLEKHIDGLKTLKILLAEPYCQLDNALMTLSKAYPEKYYFIKRDYDLFEAIRQEENTALLVVDGDRDDSSRAGVPLVPTISSVS